MIYKIRQSWLEKYAIAKEFYEQYGNLLISKSHKFKGIYLGRWIQDQRYNKKKLSEKQISLLEDIGMVWQLKKKTPSWEEMYILAKDYYNIYNNLLVPYNYQNDDINLGKWIASQRRNYFNGTLSKEKEVLLNKIHMVWNTSKYKWNINFNYAKQYYLEHNHLILPVNYTMDGHNIYNWLNNQRSFYKNKKLTTEQITLLENIKMIWNLKEASWLEQYNYLKQYKEQYGNINIPTEYIINGHNLHSWLKEQRYLLNINKMSKERIKLLSEIGVYTNSLITNWNIKLRLATYYYKEHGNLLIPRDYKIEGINLGRWISNLRLKKDKLNCEQILQLEKIGMQWKLIDYERKSWEESYAIAKEYYLKYHNLLIESNYYINNYNLSNWIKNQRDYYKLGKLSEKQIYMLEDIGMVWNINNYKLCKKDLSNKQNLIYCKKRLEKILLKMLEKSDSNQKFDEMQDIKKIENDYIKILGL